MKYLESERFIVNSNDKEARKNYNDNYDRIFGEKKEEVPSYVPNRCPDCGADVECRHMVSGAFPVVDGRRDDVLQIGWLCPLCPKEQFRYVAAIDYEDRTFGCMPAGVVPDVKHNIDDIK